MKSVSFSALLRCAGLIAIALVAVAIPSVDHVDATAVASFFVMSNKSSGNSVITFVRAPDGSLTRQQEVFTHGMGTGGSNDPLGSQGALALTPQFFTVLAVNPGSNEISGLATVQGKLRFVSKINSGGTFPASVALFGVAGLVLNKKGTPNLASFIAEENGTLFPVSATFNLPGGVTANPVQASITHDGANVIVTESGTNQIDVFPRPGGAIMAAAAYPSAGGTPSGFGLTTSGVLVVAESNGGAAGAGSVSSYQIMSDHSLSLISGAVGNGQTGSSKLVIAPKNRYAFVSNTSSDSISSYSLDQTGHLSPVSAVAATTGAGSAPIDLVMSGDGKYLYVICSKTGTIQGFQVSGGVLTSLPTTASVPRSAQGIVGR